MSFLKKDRLTDNKPTSSIKIRDNGDIVFSRVESGTTYFSAMDGNHEVKAGDVTVFKDLYIDDINVNEKLSEFDSINSDGLTNTQLFFLSWYKYTNSISTSSKTTDNGSTIISTYYKYSSSSSNSNIPMNNITCNRTGWYVCGFDDLSQSNCLSYIDNGYWLKTVGVTNTKYGSVTSYSTEKQQSSYQALLKPIFTVDGTEISNMSQLLDDAAVAEATFNEFTLTPLYLRKGQSIFVRIEPSINLDKLFEERIPKTAKKWSQIAFDDTSDISIYFTAMGHLRYVASTYSEYCNIYSL